MASFLALWWVLPTSILFSTVAVGSGVSGALFFSPLFMLVVGLAPAQAVGAGLSLTAHQLPAPLLRTIFGVGLLVLAGFLILVRSPEASRPGEKSGPVIERKSRGLGTTTVKARNGTVYEYPTCWRLPGVMLAGVGGLFTGLVSAGLPEITTTAT